MEKPYRVEVEHGGCETCGDGKQWCVVGPDDVALGITFGVKEDAEELADMLSDAYVMGKRDVEKETAEVCRNAGCQEIR